MIIVGRQTVPYIGIDVLVTNAMSEPQAADAPPTATFYRVDGTTGNFALDISVGTNGVIVMQPLVGVLGAYTCGVASSALIHTQYLVRVDYTIGASARAHHEHITILTEYDVISRDATTVQASVGLVLRGQMTP